MSKRDAEINITGNSEDAKQSVKDLENFSRKSFNQMSADAEKQAEEVSDAFKKSGLRMEKDIKKSSDDARKRYKTIKNSGTASANDIKRAHGVMTRKIKANNREMSLGAGLVSKGFKAMRSNLLATTLAISGVVIGLRKAFDFAETAAKLKAQKLAFKNFTESLGVDADDLIKKLKETSRGTVSQADLIGSAGKALLLGLDPSKIVKLLEIARASAKITGESLTTLFNDVAVGTGRASKLILDNLGIQFSQGEATRRAAEALGVKKDQLTANQIATGNLNEVIRQGQPIIERVGKDFTNQADVLAKIKARYSDMVVILGQKFLKIMPKVELIVLKVTKRFLLNIKVISKLAKSFNVLTDLLHITSGSADRADVGIENLTRGMAALDKQIAEATTTMDDMAKAEESSVETSKKIIEQARKRKELLNEEEGIINKNLAVKVAAINKANEMQKIQNALLKKSISSTRAELRELEAEVNKAANFSKQILDEIAASEKRRAQTGFDPLEKMVDDLERAEDLFKKATQERAAGNLDAARELTLTAVQAANAILEVQKGAEKESEVSKGELAKAVFEAEKLTKAAKDFAAEMQTAATTAVPLVQKQIEALEAELVAGKDTLKGVKTSIAEATSAAQLLKNKLSENTTATHTQIINTINTGGNGGPGFNTGGPIPGYGGGDKVPIMTEGGEHVIRKESVRKLGRNAADAFNRGSVRDLIAALPVQHFKEGGEVKGSTANVNLSLNDKTFAMQAEQSVADEFVDEIKTINIVRGRKQNIY